MQKLKEDYVGILKKYDRMLKANNRLSGSLPSKDQQDDNLSSNMDGIQK
jgi:hypothetical protein